VITEPYIDAGSGSVVVTISAMLGGGLGVVGIDLNLHALSDNVKQVAIGREGYEFNRYLDCICCYGGTTGIHAGSFIRIVI
jgi:hypothetical protein